jgi:ArsR family transcriptional regulator
MKYKENARVFKTFCDENRLHILDLLSTGEQCACVLLEQLHIGQSGLSYHMKILVESGVVDSRQEGKWTYYKISEEGSKQAIKLLEEMTKIANPDSLSRCCV